VVLLLLGAFRHISGPSSFLFGLEKCGFGLGFTDETLDLLDSQFRVGRPLVVGFVVRVDLGEQALDIVARLRVDVEVLCTHAKVQRLVRFWVTEANLAWRVLP
jgi:hypothetical protein